MTRTITGKSACICVRKLAGIIEAQRREISEMKALITDLEKTR